MKLTKEDIRKYGTKDKKKILVGVSRKEISEKAFKKINHFRDVKSCPNCKHFNDGWFSAPICMALYGDIEPETLNYDTDAILEVGDDTICDLYK
jgi:hypothetical protein